MDREEYPEQLWHFSEHGIYRSLDDDFEELPAPSDSEIFHPKYKRPAKCFAYIGNHEDPKSWKLPYLHIDGAVDHIRLPKAIRSIISNYRGRRVSISSYALPFVMEKLMKAAIDSGKMPYQNPRTPNTFIQFAHFLSQLGILAK